MFKVIMGSCWLLIWAGSFALWVAVMAGWTPDIKLIASCVFLAMQFGALAKFDLLGKADEKSKP